MGTTFLAMYVHVLNFPQHLRTKLDNKGGETVQNTIWILVGLAIALIVGWVFFKEQIMSFANSVWNNLSGYAKGELDSNNLKNVKP